MKHLLSFALGAACIFGLSGCGSSSTEDPNAIKVGFFTSLTGANATFGQDTIRGTELAVEQINEAGGVLDQPLRLVVKDTQSKAGETSLVVRELITRDQVVALLGEVASGRSLEAAPIAQSAGIPMISPSSTNEKVTQAGDYIFRVCFIDSFQGGVAAKFARSLGVSRAAILTDTSKDYSVGLSENFKKEFTSDGGEIVSTQSYSAGDKDFTPQLTAIKAQNPEAVYLPSYYTEAPLIIRQARQLGLDVPFIGGDGWDSPDMISIGGDALNGTYFSNHFSPESKETIVQDFSNRYREKYGEAPPALAALAYDSVLILADAIRRAGSTEPEALRNALAATSGFPGVTGHITLDENRNPTKSAVILSIQDGTVQYLETIEP